MSRVRKKFDGLEVRRIRHGDVIRAVLLAAENHHLPVAGGRFGKQLEDIFVDRACGKLDPRDTQCFRDHVVQISLLGDMVRDKDVHDALSLSSALHPEADQKLPASQVLRK